MQDGVVQFYRERSNETHHHRFRSIARSRLGDANWLDGAFSVGDLMMVTVLRRLESSGLLANYPRLTA